MVTVVGVGGAASDASLDGGDGADGSDAAIEVSAPGGETVEVTVEADEGSTLVIAVVSGEKAQEAAQEAADGGGGDGGGAVTLGSDVVQVSSGGGGGDDAGEMKVQLLVTGDDGGGTCDPPGLLASLSDVNRTCIAGCCRKNSTSGVHTCVCKPGYRGPLCDLEAKCSVLNTSALGGGGGGGGGVGGGVCHTADVGGGQMVCECNRIGGLAVLMHQTIPQNQFEHIAERAEGGANAALAVYVVGCVVALYALAMCAAWRWDRTAIWTSTAPRWLQMGEHGWTTWAQLKLNTRLYHLVLRQWHVSAGRTPFTHVQLAHNLATFLLLALCCVLTFLEKEQCTAEQAGLKTLMTALSSSLFAMVLRMLLRAGNLTGDLGRAVVAAEAERMREQMEDIIERPRQKALLGRPELQRMQSFGRKKVSFMRRAASRRIPSARGGGLSGWWERVRMRVGRGSLPPELSEWREVGDASGDGEPTSLPASPPPSPPEVGALVSCPDLGAPIDDGARRSVAAAAGTTAARRSILRGSIKEGGGSAKSRKSVRMSIDVQGGGGASTKKGASLNLGTIESGLLPDIDAADDDAARAEAQSSALVVAADDDDAPSRPKPPRPLRPAVTTYLRGVGGKSAGRALEGVVLLRRDQLRRAADGRIGFDLASPGGAQLFLPTIRLSEPLQPTRLLGLGGVRSLVAPTESARVAKGGRGSVEARVARSAAGVAEDERSIGRRGSLEGRWSRRGRHGGGGAAAEAAGAAPLLRVVYDASQLPPGAPCNPRSVMSAAQRRSAAPPKASEPSLLAGAPSSDDGDGGDDAPWQLRGGCDIDSWKLVVVWAINAASFGGALAWLYIMLLGIPEPAERDAAWSGLLVGDYLKALALQFTVQEAIKILLLTFVSPQFAAKLFPPKGGRTEFSRTLLHQVPNALLAGLKVIVA